MVRKARFGLETRLFALILLTSTIVSALAGVVIYQYERSIILERINADLLRSAKTLAATIDPADLERVHQEGPASSLAQEYIQWADRVAEQTGLSNVYTCTRTDENHCMLGIATSSLDVSAAYDLGGSLLGEAKIAGFAGEDSVTDLFTDEYGTFKSAAVPLRDASGQVIAIVGIDLDAEFVTQELDRLMQNILISMAVVTLIWLFVAWTITRVILRPVSGTLEQFRIAIGRLADGDLTVEEMVTNRTDEIGAMTQAFNQMVHQLRQLVQNVGESSEALLIASAELTASSDQSAKGAGETAESVGGMAQGAAEQAVHTDEVRSTLEQVQQTIQQLAVGSQQTASEVSNVSHLLGQMAHGVHQVAESAQEAATYAGRAADSAHTGADVVGRTVAGMERIRQVVGESAEEIRQLGQLSDQIGEITVVISDIAEQTNLLALNAAIEAARAGEHGRGFAVVADEVRKLAERSAASTQEISNLIGNIQARTVAAVRAMEAGNAEVETGSQLAADAGQALAEILDTVGHAAQDVERISGAAQEVQQGAEQVVKAFESVAAVTEESTAATEEMAAGATQVMHSVEQVAAVSQENAAAAQQVAAAMEELSASAEEVASSAQTLSAIAERLKGQVQQFRL